MEKSLLEVSNLQIGFETDHGTVVPVDNVSFTLNPGETIGIVGESGCGKSVTSLSIMRLLGEKGRILNGYIKLNDTNLLNINEGQMRNIRGHHISMIFQEPMTSLNPVFSIGHQMMEGIRLHKKLRKKDAQTYAINMLKKVGIPRAEEIIHEYPHVLSGGMRQRVMIAMALACEPQLLIADEPTTALDVTIQAQILELMKDLKSELGTSIMLITHDLGVVAEMADRVIVMYAGQVVEEADVFTLFKNPKHPYTIGLMNSVPNVEDKQQKRLTSIPGTIPSLQELPLGCRFNTRCQYAKKQCFEEAPPLIELGEGRSVRCWLVKASDEKATEEIYHA